MVLPHFELNGFVSVYYTQQEASGIFNRPSRFTGDPTATPTPPRSPPAARPR
jgi:hypothetical protein